ncbi:MFS transporter [Humitalea sp. 24SJ18S-53]|uniref:MFS transporter n=1 Tax=Humitalea sp. 24SJ18S-53 TaxID=3422307 RepID=UPI003D66B061
MNPASGSPLARDPDFLRLWLVGLMISLVRWLEMLAVSLFVYDRTGSPLLVSMMVMLRVLPMGLFGAFLGALAERLELFRALIGILCVSVATSAVLAVLTSAGLLEVWHLALSSFVSGVAWAADSPVRRMLIGQVAGPSRMARAMSADVGSNNASRMVGPGLSGVLFALLGVQGAFLAGIGFYLVALVAAVTLRARSGVAAAPETGVAARIAVGLAAVRADPRLTGTMVVTIIFNVFGWPFTSLVPVIAQDHLGLGPSAIGLLSSMDGIGALVGVFVIAAWVRPADYRRCFMSGVVVYLVMLTVFVLVPHPALAGAALVVTGAGQAGFSIMQATLIYLSSPPGLRSRVLGLQSVCIGLGPIGFVNVGLMANMFGAQTAGVVTGIEGLLALFLTRKLWSRI